MVGCGSCRRLPPEAVCKACHQENEGCTMHCRDAFVYDPTWTDEDIVKVLKSDYVIGGNSEGLEIGIKVPERILALLA